MESNLFNSLIGESIIGAVAAITAFTLYKYMKSVNERDHADFERRQARYQKVIDDTVAENKESRKELDKCRISRDLMLKEHAKQIVAIESQNKMFKQITQDLKQQIVKLSTKNGFKK